MVSLSKTFKNLTNKARMTILKPKKVKKTRKKRERGVPIVCLEDLPIEHQNEILKLKVYLLEKKVWCLLTQMETEYMMKFNKKLKDVIFMKPYRLNGTQDRSRDIDFKMPTTAFEFFHFFYAKIHPECSLEDFNMLKRRKFCMAFIVDDFWKKFGLQTVYIEDHQSCGLDGCNHIERKEATGWVEIQFNKKTKRLRCILEVIWISGCGDLLYIN